MHVINEEVLARFVPRPVPDAPPEEDDAWGRVMAHLRDWLPKQQLLDTLCAAVAAELSLSTVALFRREADGGLSRIAGADGGDGFGKVRDRRAVDGTFVVHPWREPSTPEVACWTFPDRGHHDVLVFAGHSENDHPTQWSEWARRMAVMVVQAPDGAAALRGPAPASSGEVESDQAQAVPTALGQESCARFAAYQTDIVDLEGSEHEEPHVRVSLEGLEALEPLGEDEWRRLLAFSAARLVAIAGADGVAELADGEFRVRLPRDPAQAVQVLDTLRRALIAPVPGIGSLPALQVRFGPD